MRLVWARPVRSFLRSAWKVCTHLLMRAAASFFTSSSMGLSPRRACGSLDRHRGTDLFALYDPGEVAGIVEIEHPQRQAVVAAHDDGGGVHHVETLGEHPVEGQLRVAYRGGVLHRVIGIDAVDLDGAQCRGGVRGEERIAGAGAENRDAALFQMAHGATADVVLAHLIDAD